MLPGIRYSKDKDWSQLTGQEMHVNEKVTNCTLRYVVFAYFQSKK